MGAGWAVAARPAAIALRDRGARLLGEVQERLAPGGEGRRLSDALRTARDPILSAWRASQFDPERLRRVGVPAEELPPPAALTRGFLRPLFELLRAWLRTGEARYADVYLDERLRYAPHQLDWEVRRGFFREVLADDEAALAAAMPDRAARKALGRALERLHAPLLAPAPARPLRLLALGDCLMNELRVALVSRCRAEGVPLDFRGSYFSALYGHGLATAPLAALLRRFPADLVALSFLSYKGIAPYAALLAEADRLPAREVAPRVEAVVGVMRDFLGRLRDHTDAPFLLHNASGLPLTRARALGLGAPLSRGRRAVLEGLGAAVAELAAATPRCLLLDEAAVARQRGLRACGARVVPRSVAAGGQFHTARFGEFLTPAYLDVLRSYELLGRCKVLAVDFDHTLWEGVMAEGQVAHRRPLQRLLRRLREAGVLLVAVSKNDPRSIRWEELELTPDDFVLRKVSWEPKVASLREAAQELDLGLDAFVLVDDNPVERELVRQHLPQVGTLDPASPRALPWLTRMLAFPAARPTEEGRRRTALYREQAARRAALRPDLDYPAMMAGLGLRARFGPARPADLERLAELCQRTNQFNTTTRRWGRAELAGLLSDADHAVYAAGLADRFGDQGLVALAVVRREERARTRTIEAFVMSCRAMGFGLEQLVLRRVLDAESGPGVTFVGRYLPTERNGPCSGLYPDAGFEPRADGAYVLAPEAPRPPAPAWFAEGSPPA